MVSFLPDEAWFRFNPRGIHGAPHTTRVLVWADVLARQVGEPGALRYDELLWSAAVHDVGRFNHGIDTAYGARSASGVRSTLATQRPPARTADLAFVAELCQWHEVQDRAIERLSLELLILKDADALDRARLGDLDPTRLRLARSVDFVEAAERLERATDDYGSVSVADVLAAATRMNLAP